MQPFPINFPKRKIYGGQTYQGKPHDLPYNIPGPTKYRGRDFEIEVLALQRLLLNGTPQSQRFPRDLVRFTSTFFITVDKTRLQAAYQSAPSNFLPEIDYLFEILNLDRKKPDNILLLKKLGLTISRNKPSRKLARINEDHNIFETFYLDVFHVPLTEALDREEEKKSLFSLLHDHLVRFLTNTSRSDIVVGELEKAGIIFKIQNPEKIQ